MFFKHTEFCLVRFRSNPDLPGNPVTAVRQAGRVSKEALLVSVSLGKEQN